MSDNGASLRQRLRYWFDERMASGTSAMMLWLALASFLMIVLVGLMVVLVGGHEGESVGLVEATWQAMLRTMDPGTMGGDEGWPFRIASLIASLGGVLVVGSLIGLLANGIGDRLSELRRGRTPVLEKGHTLILGWSAKIYPIVSEIVIANENQSRASIVILADRDKQEMERSIAARVEDRKTTRIVCRSGIPQEVLDLKIASAGVAKSIVLLNPGGDDGDAEVVKAALALFRAADVPATTPVIAEIHDRFTARALEQGTNGSVTTVRSASIIAKVTAQVCRQPGLSHVYQELFDFDGDEIYFQAVPELDGATFGQAQLSFEHCTPIGIHSRDGATRLNPAPETILHAGDQLIVIAADDDVSGYTGERVLSAAAIEANRDPHEPENVVLIGWNSIAPAIITELDGYVAAGSRMTVYIDSDVIPVGDVHLPNTSTLSVEVRDHGLDPVSLKELVSTDAPDHIVILCYRDHLTEAQADARVLLTLLHLRPAIAEADAKTNIVAELMDERDVDLTPHSEGDEFIVSERITALVIAQLSENPALAPVFEDLLDEEGAEVYLKPATLYSEATADFDGIVAAARARGEVAIGYQHGADGARQVFINPLRSATIQPADTVIVLSERDD